MDSLNLPGILTPEPGLLFWMLIAFIVVFVLLARFGFPVITSMVEKRKEFIETSLRNAHEAAEKLAGLQQESERMIMEAREQQASIVKDAAATRDAIIADAHASAKTEAARIMRS